MTRFFFLLLSLGIYLSCIDSVFAQDYDFKVWNDSTLSKANSAKDVAGMTEEEKKVIFYINLVRHNPNLFAQTYLKTYMKANGIKQDKWSKSLFKYLKETEPMHMLKPKRDLIDEAEKHAADMGESGRTGHNTSDGGTFPERMQQFTEIYNGINENCNYGYDKALDIVIDLLIDRDVPNYGHRKNILDPHSYFIGVAIRPHKKWSHNCVQEFAGKQIK